MLKIRLCLLFLFFSLLNIYAGVGFKGIYDIEVDSQGKYAFFPITYENWADYEIGVFDIENSVFLKGIKILEDYPGFRMQRLALLSDTVLLAHICNEKYGEQNYITKLLFIDIDSELIFKTIEYNNDIISIIKTYQNNIYLVFESGKFIKITESSSEPVFTLEINGIRFPEMKINDGIAAVTHNTRDVSLFNVYSGESISKIQTESGIVDLYVDKEIIIVLHSSSMEKFTIQGELILKKDFSEYGISVCKQFIPPNTIFMRIVENGEGVYYTYSLSNNQFTKFPKVDGLYISKIIQLNKNRLLLGLSEIVGIFQLPKRKPSELITVVDINGI